MENGRTPEPDAGTSALYRRWMELVDRHNAGYLEIADITLGDGPATMTQEQRKGIEKLERERDDARDEYLRAKEAYFSRTQPEQPDS